MKAQNFLLVMLTAGLFLSCGGTEPVGSPAVPVRLSIDVDTVDIFVGDSIRIRVQAFDVFNNLLPDRPQASSANPSIATIAIESLEISGNFNLAFWVKAERLGATGVLVALGDLSQLIPVNTAPAAIQLVETPDTIVSLDSLQLAGTVVGADGRVIPDLDIRWRTSPYRDNVTVDSITGWVQARRLGAGVVVATAGDSLSTQIKFFIVAPDTFPGTITPNSGPPGTVVTISTPKPIRPEVDYYGFGGRDPLRLSNSANSSTFVVPYLGWAGTFGIDVSTDYFRSEVFFNLTAIAPLDPSEPNDDPLAAPDITNGAHTLALSGNCIAGESDDPVDDCSDFFTVTNTTTDSINVEARASWVEYVDVNILWTDELFTTTVGNSDGARLRNSGTEFSMVRIPPQTTWRLWINLFSIMTYDSVAVVRMEINGLP